MASEHPHQAGDDPPLTKERFERRSEPDARRNDDESEGDHVHANISNSLSRPSQTMNPLLRSSDGRSNDDTIRSEKKELDEEISHFVSSFPPASSRDKNGKEEYFRILLADALKKAIVTPVASSSNAPSHNKMEQNGRSSSSVVRPEGEVFPIPNESLPKNNAVASENGNILQELVQEKHTKCLLLQQTIDSKDTEIAQLQTLLENLRESKKQEAGNVQKLRIALKRACENATSARDVANKAEANGKALKTKIEAFENVIRETKRASALLLQEQEEIGFGSEGMENEIIQLQAKLAGHGESKRNLQQQNHKLSLQILDLKGRMNELEDELETEQNERLSMKRKLDELEETAILRQGQQQRLQDELDSAQTLLVDSTSAAAESKNALKDCKQAIDRLEEANQHLHQQLQKHQATLRKQEASHQDELNLAKKEHQEMQLQLDNEKEKYRTLKLEKMAADKRQEAQAAKIFALERRLKDSTNLMTTSVAVSSKSGVPNANCSKDSYDTKGDYNRDFLENTMEQHHPSKAIGAFAVPRLDGIEKPQHAPGAAKKCSICWKDSSGLMKKCECPRKDCQFRAHTTCVQQKLLGRVSGNSHLDSSNTTHNLLPPPIILCHSETPRRTMKRKASEQTNHSEC